jgi:hypothetical protein
MRGGKEGGIEWQYSCKIKVRFKRNAGEGRNGDKSTNVYIKDDRDFLLNFQRELF